MQSYVHIGSLRPFFSRNMINHATKQSEARLDPRPHANHLYTRLQRNSPASVLWF